jgi:hypothetical protein
MASKMVPKERKQGAGALSELRAFFSCVGWLIPDGDFAESK